MEPRIQFAKSSDGVSIAYYEIGPGQPVIHMPGSITNLQSEWRAPGRREWYERFSANYRLIRYDRRGFGMSDRNVTDFSVEALVRDIEAVADQMGLERLAVWAPGWSGPAGIAFATSHPERVSRLILYATDARGSAMMGIQDDTSEYLLERDWELFTEVLARQTYEWPESDRIRTEAANIREAVTQEAMQSYFDAKRSWDVTELLPQVKCPTLVLYRPEWVNRGYIAKLNIDLMRAMAQAIPGARLMALEGTDLAPYLGDAAALMRVVVDFLAEEQRETGGPATALAEGGLRTILFTDLEGSTALTERLGDARAREVLREHERAVREALAAHGGSEVKTMGDGFMASFWSAMKALECAVAIQKAVVGAEDLAPLRVRCGLNAGEPIAEEQDLFGTAVITAARIAAQAQGGEILVSDVVRQLVAGKGFLFSDRGENTLRGFEHPVRVWEMRWQGEA